MTGVSVPQRPLRQVITSACPCVAILATKDHTVTLLPFPPLGWGGEWKEEGKNSWVGIRAV